MVQHTVTYLLIFLSLAASGQKVTLVTQGGKRIMNSGPLAGNIAVTAPIPESAPSFTNSYYLSLNGSDEYAYLGSALNLGKTCMLSYWVNPLTMTTYEVHFGEDSYTGDLMLMNNNAGVQYLMIATEKKSKTGIYSSNTWTHIVVVKNGTAVDIYKDGAYNYTHTMTGDNDLKFSHIGATTAAGSLLAGYIDNAGCWSTAPAAYSGTVPSEVTALYGDGTPEGAGDPGAIFTANRVEYYPFEQNLNGAWNSNNLTGANIDAGNFVNY